MQISTFIPLGEITPDCVYSIETDADTNGESMSEYFSWIDTCIRKGIICF